MNYVRKNSLEEGDVMMMGSHTAFLARGLRCHGVWFCCVWLYEGEEWEPIRSSDGVAHDVAITTRD